MRIFWNKKGGQTLIEVLVTLLVIGISVIALIRFQNYLAYTNSLAMQTADAITLAQSEIETLRDFQVLTTTSGYTAYTSIASGSNVVAGTSASYSVAWTVTTTAIPSYKQLSVTVSWTDRRGTAQSITQVSYVAGIQPSNSAVIM